MKIARMFAAAGLVVASLGVSTVADAQSYRGDRHGSYDRDYRGRDHHRGDRYARYDRHDRGRHYGWNQGRGHQRCWVEYRHHRQVRVCR